MTRTEEKLKIKEINKRKWDAMLYLCSLNPKRYKLNYFKPIDELMRIMYVLVTLTDLKTGYNVDHIKWFPEASP